MCVNRWRKKRGWWKSCTNVPGQTAAEARRCSNCVICSRLTSFKTLQTQKMGASYRRTTGIAKIGAHQVMQKHRGFVPDASSHRDDTLLPWSSLKTRRRRPAWLTQEPESSCGITTSQRLKRQEAWDWEWLHPSTSSGPQLLLIPAECGGDGPFDSVTLGQTMLN